MRDRRKERGKLLLSLALPKVRKGGEAALFLEERSNAVDVIWGTGEECHRIFA